MPQAKLTGKEKQAVAMCMAIHSEMHKESGILEKRLKAQGGNAWRDWRCVMTMLDRLSGIIVDSMTDTDCLWLQRLLGHAKVGIDLPGPLKKKDYVIIDAKVLSHIVSLAAREECTLCTRQGKQIKRCELRDALLTVCPPPDGESDGWCEYAEADWDDIG